jgi:hypothetical protein
MAYIIYTQSDQVYRIAETDTHRDEINGIEHYNSISISDSDFAKVKTGELTLNNYDSDNSQHSTVARDVAGGGFIFNQDMLTTYLTEVKKQLKIFCSISSNSTKALYSTCNTYLTFLNDFDISAHDFTATPIYSWEKYCEDNSISYVHPLQLP